MKMACELAPHVGVTTACSVSRVPRSSHYQKRLVKATDGRKGLVLPGEEAAVQEARRRRSHRALSPVEEREVLRILNSERFADRSPGLMAV